MDMKLALTEPQLVYFENGFCLVCMSLTSGCYYFANTGTPDAKDASQIPVHMSAMVPTTLAKKTVKKMATPFLTPNVS
jgi:hypothetical protein